MTTLQHQRTVVGQVMDLARPWIGSKLLPLTQGRRSIFLQGRTLDWGERF